MQLQMQPTQPREQLEEEDTGSVAVSGNSGIVATYQSIYRAPPAAAETAQTLSAQGVDLFPTNKGLDSHGPNQSSRVSLMHDVCEDLIPR